LPCSPGADERAEPDDAFGGPLALEGFHVAAVVVLLLVGAALVGPLQDYVVPRYWERVWGRPLESVPWKSGREWFG